MAKRRLTPEEKSRLIKERCNEAVTAHPDKMIFVCVEDQTDENGEAIVWVHFGRDPPAPDSGVCRSVHSRLQKLNDAAPDLI